ncbi:conserved phage C-terminal domain-containing protein [Riemerella anatipestifer]|nr:conserved phage C-terminal domain-containing protein [Riemerella anatipestifer]ADQ83126.1 hypothetical protein Riean_1973 [Riemerella anatipestifer ATCC 11845 = DSM 15868]SNV79682.1 Conserved phage C-terminus (Phg_2220_C) [Riemerella anatipestifer]
MNYIVLINKFWQCNLERCISPNDTRLYFYLLHTCNSLGWKQPFGHSDRHLSIALGMSVNTVRDARNRLMQLGLIDFKTPQKRSKGIDGQTKYVFPTVSTGDTVLDTVSDTDIDTVSDTVLDTVSDTNNKLNKTKLNVLLEKEPKGSLSDLEEEGKAKPNNDIDFEKLLNFISDKTKRKFKTINDQIKRKYKARLKEGYTKEDILEAIENAVKDKYHMEQGYKYLTPEFFSRPVTLDKYKNTTSQKATEKKKTYGIWSV